MQYLDIFYIIGIILALTIFQRFYFIILSKIESLSLVLNWFYRFIIRFGVIVHEFCHMFFAVITGNKIEKIDLFKADGGQVILSSKDYIGELPKYGFSFNFLFFMCLNQIGLFLVSFGPLVFGLISGYLVFYYLGINSFKDVLKLNLDLYQITFLIFYSVFIPSFVLSFQDIKNFFISSQDNILATIMASIINTFIFLVFIYFFSKLFFQYLVLFTVLFLIMFFLQAIIYVVFLVFFYTIKVIKK
ncbi:MAG: M50 family metallopeptidase [Candidatus Gracilibacteria bacterium]|nr:M50 family metallopeptidase [Candidatus Gracilibacteria bacterium]